MQEQILDALRRGDTAAALDAARGFADGAPDDPQAQRLLALALRGSGDGEGARAAITRALALAPGDASLHLDHARLLLGGRDTAAATAALDTAIGVDPNEFGAYVLKAELAMAGGDLDEAARLARLAARVSPEHPTLQALEGSIALRRGDADEALRLLGAANARAPRDPVTLHALAFAYMAKGHLAFAEQALRSLRELLPRSPAVRLMLAQLLARQGRPGEAADELMTITEPANIAPPVRVYIGELELAAGRPERALPVLRGALEAQPRDARTLAAIGEAWRRLGAFEDGRRTLDALVATVTDSEDLWRARLAFEPAGAGALDVVSRWQAALPESAAALEACMAVNASEGRMAEAETAALALLERVPGHPRAQMCVLGALLERDPAAAVERVQAMRQEAAGADATGLDAWLGLALHRSGDHAGALEAWRRGAAARQGGLPLPAATPAPASWPEPAAATPGAPPAAFLVGLPGSLVERAALLLEPILPVFRSDRFGDTPPADAFQDLGAWARIASGEVAAADVAASWRAALPGRGIGGAIVDWLPWWDNAYAAAMRAALPEALLVVMLRDPRDMLLDWLAYGARTPFAVPSPEAAAAWLAAALDQLATLHEDDVVRHRLVRVDAIGEDPQAMAAELATALGTTLPEPPGGYFGPARFAPGTWRAYAGLLAAPFAALAPVARRLGYPDA